MLAPLTKIALNPAQHESLQELSKWLLGGAAVGAGARSAAGLFDMLRRGTASAPKQQGPMVINVPYKPRREPEPEPEEPRRDRLAAYAAGASASGPASTELKAAGSSAAGSRTADCRTVDSRAALAGSAKAASEGTSPLWPADWWLGSQAKNKEEVPVINLARTLVGGAAAMGGWKAIDAHLKQKRKADLEAELSDEQRRLHQAEMGQFKPVELRKLSADCQAVIEGKEPQDEHWKEVGAGLEKLAEDPGFLEQMWGHVTQPYNAPVLKYFPWTNAAKHYATLAGLGGLGAGALAYNYTRSQDPERQKAKVIREQLEEARRSRPPELLARLVPVGPDGAPLSDRQKAKLQRQAPERLAPGESKEGSTAPDLEERARAFVAQLLGR